ncbi:sirohydrochlorin chelatase [Streptomyces sp. SDr-06]|uniref:sirohydrochlorin chelatase n=1 Tax=Streptomyces sp. SDr-06 TaxID=2267702 RepID=UPI000DEBB387|nr:sirohydrochlorin chelatase [Streptomyces sp. SDr-06]RCH69298.1 sirohydrochlorin chelatase [Streptomyces sp. SDr-06]
MTETETSHPFPRSRPQPVAEGGPRPEPRAQALTLDTTAELLTRITAQLGSRLGHLRLNGTRTSMTPIDRPALVAVAHGSRDPGALRTVTALLDRVRELRPGLDVRLGHIELNRPLLPDTLDGLRGEAVVVPLLLGRGHHVKHDVPHALATAGRHLGARVAAPLGPHPLLVEALYGRLMEAGWQLDAGAVRGAGIVLAAAGSRDPDSAADTRRTAQLLSERLGGVPVLPAYASAASPTVPEALRALAARGRHRVAVASYFTAPGRFATQSAAAAPWLAAAPLGAHPAMARLVLHRYDEALARTAARDADAAPAAALVSA